MSNSERLAIAAHLHVMLRRRTGRVIDTEWLASNAEYAAEITRFSKAKAVEENAPELEELAAKLEAIAFEVPRKQPLMERAAKPPDKPPSKTPASVDPAFSHGAGDSVGGPRFRLPTESGADASRKGYSVEHNRYIGRLR